MERKGKPFVCAPASLLSRLKMFIYVYNWWWWGILQIHLAVRKPTITNIHLSPRSHSFKNQSPQTSVILNWTGECQHSVMMESIGAVICWVVFGTYIVITMCIYPGGVAVAVIELSHRTSVVVIDFFFSSTFLFITILLFFPAVPLLSFSFSPPLLTASLVPRSSEQTGSKTKYTLKGRLMSRFRHNEVDSVNCISVSWSRDKTEWLVVTVCSELQ